MADMIMRCMDDIPFEILIPPLSAVFLNKKHSCYKLSAQIEKIEVEAIFQYHPSGHFLSLKPLDMVDLFLQPVSNSLFNIVLILKMNKQMKLQNRNNDNDHNKLNSQSTTTS